MQTYWTVFNDRAELKTPRLSGLVEPSFPWRGFSPAFTKQRGVAVLKADLGFVAGDAPESVTDLYQRGVDLAATYAQSPERHFRPQIYWRYLDDDATGNDVTGLELIVSAQTSLLDSQPKTVIESTLPAGEVLDLSTAMMAACLFRPTAWSVSYCQMMFASDLAQSQLTKQNTLPCLSWQLFHERLEKGVIRRGRIRGMFLPRERDSELAAACAAAFLQSPLVLST
jgi:hypothetical protein